MTAPTLNEFDMIVGGRGSLTAPLFETYTPAPFAVALGYRTPGDGGGGMRVSRVEAGDLHTVTIQYQHGTPLVTLGGRTGVGWADFLFVVSNGWVVFAKGPG